MVNIATSSSLSLHPVPQTLQTYSCTYSLPTLFFFIGEFSLFLSWIPLICWLTQMKPESWPWFSPLIIGYYPMLDGYHLVI